MYTTTELHILRNNPSRFTWGQILEITDVGPHFTIVEFAPNRESENSTNYHVYVDQKDTSRSASSLEGALLIAIAYLHLGPDSCDTMARAGAKLLDVSII